MSTENGAGAAAGQSTPPAGESGNGGKTYTEEEVQGRLRGQGKEIEKLMAKVKSFEEAEAARKAKADDEEKSKLAEQGKYKDLLAQEKASRQQLEQQIQQLTERETGRLTRLSESNADRVKALPKELQSLIPPNLDADAMAEQIGRVEALVKEQTVSVHGGSGRAATTGDPLAEARARAAKKSGFIGANS